MSLMMSRWSHFDVAAAADESRKTLWRDLVETSKNFQKMRPQDQPLASSDPLAPGFDEKIESIPAMVDALNSDDPASQLEGTTLFLDLLSTDCSFPIQKFIPRLVQFLGRDDSPQLQLEAAKALRHITSDTSENTWVIIIEEAIPTFVRLLRSASDAVLEQVVGALGNIALVSPGICDYVLRSGALDVLLVVLEKSACKALPQENAITLRKATWTLSELCGGSYDLTSPALPVVRELIKSDDVEILTNVCETLCSFCHGGLDNMRKIVEGRFCSRLVDLLGHQSPSVHLGALHAVGNIASSGDADLIQAILDQGNVLPLLKTILTENDDESTRETACWAIANISSGNSKQINALIDAGFVPHLRDLLKSDCYVTQLDAALAISNITSRCSEEQIKDMVDKVSIIEPLLRAIGPGSSVTKACLQTLGNILEAEAAKLGNNREGSQNSGDADSYLQMITAADGFELLKCIKDGSYYVDKETEEKAIEILKKYWAYGVECGGNEHGVPPNGNKAGSSSLLKVQVLY